MGSGVVIHKAGYVLTSDHVVNDSKIAIVIFNSGAQYQGNVIQTDAARDLALIQLSGNNVQFPYANLGTSVESDDLQAGNNIAVVGYPAYANSGEPTVTGGVICAFPAIESVRYIQTSAAVYPGSSGGPMLNCFGEVIGIVNGKYTNNSGACATFATAIDEAGGLIAQINGPGDAGGSQGKDYAAQLPDIPRVCPNVGCTAPDFTLQSLDGKSISLHSLKGKKALVIFTGTECPACSHLIQCVSQVYDAWPRGLLEILVIISREKSSDIERWAKENKVKCPVLPDPSGEVYNLYKPASLPAMYFINTYGDIKIKRATHFEKCAAEVDVLLRLY